MSREKQIEDIANILWHIPCGYSLNSYNDCEVIAECIYDDGGYRKQSEGEFVLFKPRRENRNATYRCSVCGKLCSSYYNDVGEWNFCPNCGAKMKGGAE